MMYFSKHITNLYLEKVFIYDIIVTQNIQRSFILKYDIESIKYKEYLQYAPAYAIEEASKALEKVEDLHMQGVLHNGLYYIVLVDLVGSTNYQNEFGNEEANNRIKIFITMAIQAIKETHLESISLYIKELGDAVLMIFQHFPDILRWLYTMKKFLNDFEETTKKPFGHRTIIHAGEISLEGVNPVCLAVSQLFKLEKNVNQGEIVLTNSAYQLAYPSIVRSYHGFEHYKNVVVNGYNGSLELYKLKIENINELKEIVNENKEYTD